MEDNIAIKVEHLSKVYKIFDKPIDRIKESLNPFGKRYSKDFYALNDVSFEIRKGETIGIIGKNGAGKSTLLKMITGVLTPTSGILQVNGRIASLLELGAGFNPEMTGIENIYMNGAIMGFSKAEMDERLESIIAFADIGDFIHQPVKMYSSGMFARLAFAVNAYVEPDILIVDEALSVGDIFFQAKCISKMEQLMERGTTVLFVSHDLDTIQSFCKKVLWIEHGKIKMSGKARDVIPTYGKNIIKNINQENDEIENDEIENDEIENDEIENDEIENDEIENDEIENGILKYNGAEYFRSGSGEARVFKVEICNELGRDVHHEIQYNQSVEIKVFVKVLSDCSCLSIVYRVKNRNGIGIIGNNTISSASDLKNKKWEKDQIICVSFKTKIPLLHGGYSLTIVISAGKTTASTKFLDWIENAYIFSVPVRMPVELFDCVEIENGVSYSVY